MIEISNEKRKKLNISVVNDGRLEFYKDGKDYINFFKENDGSLMLNIDDEVRFLNKKQKEFLRDWLKDDL